MNAPAPHPAIEEINKLIEESRALEADFKNDKTLELAELALETAKAAVAAAEAEDDSIDPEQLVDRRIEARRQEEIAAIRLERAKNAMKSRKSEINDPIRKAGRLAADTLVELVGPMRWKLESELRRVIGDDFYEREMSHYKSLLWRKGEILVHHARLMESGPSIPGLLKTVALIENARRLG